MRHFSSVHAGAAFESNSFDRLPGHFAFDPLVELELKAMDIAAEIEDWT
ncbi:hypothetical protein [Bradyrhizobium cosmicum]|nr:hypothetical protein [Bradyrhizobium cosmicum]